MLSNYLKISWRALVQNKLYTTLNVAGLSFGITCFLLIGLYLYDELTFDTMHSKADRIYRVVENRNNKGEELRIAAGSYMLATESKKSIAEIENVTRFSRQGRANIANPDNQNKFNEVVSYCDDQFLEVFDFKLLHGDRKTALSQPNSVVLVEELARRLFGTTDVVGKFVNLEYLEAPTQITGVLVDHPSNSSYPFSYMLTESTFTSDSAYRDNISMDWASNTYAVFVLLKAHTDPKEVSGKITRLVLDNFTPEAGTAIKYNLQPLPDIHLYSEDIVDGARSANVESIGRGRLIYIRIFGIVALFVLLIACINYMNLTTARATNRLKEIGIRKTVGAKQTNIINQFLIESILITTISFVISVGLVNLLLPAFNQFTNKQLSLGAQTDSRIWWYTMIVVLGIGLLSGSYPSLLLSRFNPVWLLRGLKLNNKTGLSLRKGLVVFQFTISIVMMVCTLVLYLQVKYTNNKDLGFNKNLMVVIDINSGRVRSEAVTIKTGFSKIPGVKKVSISSRVPGEWKAMPTVKVRIEGSQEDHQVAYLIGADEDFSSTFEIDLLQGKNFANNNDSANIIINETAAKLLHIDRVANQWVEIPSRSFGGSYRPLNSANAPFRARVTGICKDFNFRSLREKIAPMILAYINNPVHNSDYFTANIDGGDIPGTIKKMEKVLTEIDPTHIFEYHFLDEQLALFYAEDRRRESLLIWVALASVFIACLGLFGLATFAAEQRIKEIGVRKVLGASVIHLTSLLSRDFLRLVLIANGIAFPIAWWAADTWLQEFAYHIELKWWVFLLAGAAAIVIALITVSYQAIQAALMNPVRSLRVQ